MKDVLEAICELFDDELERQENIFAILVAQASAAKTHDIEFLEAKTEALNSLIQEAIIDEQKRLCLMQKIVNQYQLPPERQTLTELIQIVPDPWKSRMKEFQSQMCSLLEDTRAVARKGNRSMRRSLKTVNEALTALMQCVPAEHTYDGRGEEIAHPAATNPNLIDQRG